MRRLLTIALITGALALTACTRPDRFGGTGTDPGATGPGAGAIDPSTLGGANDPRSPQYFSQTIGDRVFFLVDQSTLTPQAQSTLQAQAQWLLANSDYLALIEGHADEQGTSEYNVALGARRANAVREFLIAQGVPATRLRTISYGKERPVAVCADESCWSQNRRAVTVISIATVG
jgi:peptidoglycan-associated lipoprotein